MYATDFDGCHLVQYTTCLYKAYVALIHFVQISNQEIPNYHYHKSVYANVQFNLCAKRLHGHRPC